MLGIGQDLETYTANTRRAKTDRKKLKWYRVRSNFFALLLPIRGLKWSSSCINLWFCVILNSNLLIVWFPFLLMPIGPLSAHTSCTFMSSTIITIHERTQFGSSITLSNFCSLPLYVSALMRKYGTLFHCYRCKFLLLSITQPVNNRRSDLF